MKSTEAFSQNSKYCLVAKKYWNIKRGAYLKALRFMREFPNQYEFLEIDAIKNINELRTKYRGLILLTQNPTYYQACGWSPISGRDDIIFIQKSANKSFLNSYTNGFSSYKNSDIKSFVPIITNFWLNKPNEKFPCIGFYNSPQVKPDSTEAFISFIVGLKQKVDVCIMGDFLHINSSNIRNQFHTTNNHEFWPKVTHYFQFRSEVFFDPYPNSLQEAIDNNKQIIVPKNHRSFEDGVDDVLTCIHYHTDLNTKHFDNSRTILQAKNFRNFYLKLYENNWEYHLDRSKYKTFREWCEKEL